MVVSADRWTCPVWERTFLVGEDGSDVSSELAAVQKDHAEEHARLQLVHAASRKSVNPTTTATALTKLTTEARRR